MKISILRNHTSMSQEVYMVNQNDFHFWQTDGTPDYLLVNQSKCLGIRGRNNNFSGSCIVLKPARVVFSPLIPSLLAPCVHRRLDQQLLLHCVTVCTRWKWVIITRNLEQRETAICSGWMCGNCCWPFFLFPILASIHFCPRTAFAFYVASQEITNTLGRE